MADLAGKVEGEIEIQADANEFFHCFGGEAHRMPDLCSGKVHSVDVHEGDGKTQGSVKLWTYTHDGKVETFKERHNVDEENKTLTIEGIEGDAMKIYKNYKITIQIITKDQSNFAKFTIDYEKMNEDVPNPTLYLELLINIGKHLDESLLKA